MHISNWDRGSLFWFRIKIISSIHHWVNRNPSAFPKADSFIMLFVNFFFEVPSSWRWNKYIFKKKAYDKLHTIKEASGNYILDMDTLYFPRGALLEEIQYIVRWVLNYLISQNSIRMNLKLNFESKNYSCFCLHIYIIYYIENTFSN